MIPAHVLEANHAHNQRYAALLADHRERVAATRAAETHEGLAALHDDAEAALEAWRESQAEDRRGLEALSAAYEDDTVHDAVQANAHARDEAERAYYAAHRAYEQALGEHEHGRRIASDLAFRSRRDVKRAAQNLRFERDELLRAGDAAERVKVLPRWVESRRELLQAAITEGDQEQIDQAQAAFDHAERQLEQARDDLGVLTASADQVRANWGI